MDGYILHMHSEHSKLEVKVFNDKSQETKYSSLVFVIKGPAPATEKLENEILPQKIFSTYTCSDSYGILKQLLNMFF